MIVRPFPITVESGGSDWQKSLKGSNAHNTEIEGASMGRNRPSRRKVEEVYSRDNYRCQNCDRSEKRDGVELRAHHVVPLKDGGSNDSGNVITLCRECHNAIHHGDKTAPTAPRHDGTSDQLLDDVVWKYPDDAKPIRAILVLAAIYALPFTVLSIIVLDSIYLGLIGSFAVPTILIAYFHFKWLME